MRLTLKQAEALALKHNPAVTVARLTALASAQVVRERRSAYWPAAAVNFTGVDAQENSRISAGGLNNPIIFPRAAAGTTVSQLITDFGRTRNLVASSGLAAKAEDENAIASAEQIQLAVDEAFYRALQARAVLQVAQQTVTARQAVADQVQAVFNSKLRSSLDLSFAQVNLAQAKLLLLDAQNNFSASLASLGEVLGYSNAPAFELVEESGALPPPASNVNDLITLAMRKRPDLAALDYSARAAERFRIAQRDQMFPKISALGALGTTPLAGNAALSPWYGAVGLNLEVPVFNGFLFRAQEREAGLRAQAAQERLRELQDIVARDVRTSWLSANTAYERLSVSQQLLQQASQALDLAQTRYKLGLGSMVELSQAQLQQTQAQIGGAQAEYDYRAALSLLNFQTGNY
jgi:outer membrane protein